MSDPAAPPLLDENAVLIVDDEPMVRRLVASVMERIGFEPVVASTVAEALTLLQGRRFRGYLLDYHLGDGDGLAIAREIRRREPKTPILLITGFASSSLVQEALTIGINEVLPKPFAIVELEKLALSLLGAGRKTGTTKASPLSPAETIKAGRPVIAKASSEEGFKFDFAFLRDPQKRLLAIAAAVVAVGVGLTWVLLSF